MNPFKLLKPKKIAKPDPLTEAIKCSSQRKVLTAAMGMHMEGVRDFSLKRLADEIGIGLSEASIALNALKNKGFVGRRMVGGGAHNYYVRPEGKALLDPPEDQE